MRKQRVDEAAFARVFKVEFLLIFHFKSNSFANLFFYDK